MESKKSKEQYCTRKNRDVVKHDTGGCNLVSNDWLALVVFFMCTIISVADAVPPGKSVEWDGKGAGKVIFEGKRHADEGYKCADCHTRIFKMKKGSNITTMRDMIFGKYCGACHDGNRAFSVREPQNCRRCHATVNVKEKETANKAETADTQLLKAAEDGNLQAVQSALASGANINVKDSRNRTPLILASVKGHPEIVKLLLAKGVDVNEKFDAGLTVLMLASFGGHLEVAELLLDKGADVNAKAYVDVGARATALHFAVMQGHTEVVKLLLAKGADVNVKVNSGATPLTVASDQGHTEIVKLLLAKGADVNAKEVRKGVDFTAIELAKHKGHTDIVRILENVSAKDGH